jgi:hypothetical protein
MIQGFGPSQIGVLSMVKRLSATGFNITCTLAK